MKCTKTKRDSLYRFVMIACLCGCSISGAYADVLVDTLENVADQQQTRSISGRVIDNNGTPIVGVVVTDKSGTAVVLTDANGNYTISADVGAILAFNLIGYRNADYAASAINGRDVTLETDVLNLDEVIVTGYTSQKKADLTGAVSVVSPNLLKSGTFGNAMRAAQGKVAGMTVSANGSPNPGATIRIRGEGTLNDNNPLYIIDGTPTTRSMSELATLDIESMQVLKDASSASIYGARAANGVIIITTRKGKKGTTVDFSASYSVVSGDKPYDLMNTEQRGIAQFWAIMNNNPNADPTKEGTASLYQYEYHKDPAGNLVLDGVTWKEWIDDAKTMRAADTDWQKEVLRTGAVQQYGVTMSTGNDNGRALFGLDYYGNKGTVDGSYFNRFSGRINSDFSLLKNRLRIGENFTVSKWRSDNGIGDDLFGRSRQVWSIVPVYTEDGGWGGPVGGMSDRQNPVRMVEQNRQNYNDNVRLFGNVYAEIEFMKGLIFRSSFGIDGTAHWRRHMDLTFVSGFLSENRAKTAQWSNYDMRTNNSNVLQYVFQTDKNNFDFMVGQETNVRSYQHLWGSRRDYALENIDYMWLDSGESEKDNGGGADKTAMISYFGKANYNYDNRYLASVTLRRDASSVFGVNNRWATFPAFSLGWSISNEAFWEELSDVVPQLKLRYGWGQNGNSSIDAYASYQFYSSLYDANNVWDWNWGTAYDFTGQGGTLPSGFRRTQLANHDLKWEATSQHNIGLDFAILDYKLSGSFDYYYKYTSGILFKPGYVATLGEGAGMWQNGADISNRGWELTLNYTDQFGDLGINVGGVFSHNDQTMEKIPDVVLSNYAGNPSRRLEDGTIDPAHVIIGRPRGSIYGYIADGLFQSQSEVDDHATQTGAAPGRVRYRDIDGDGVINDLDRTWIGVQNPTLEYGVNIGMTYKNFDFNIFFNGVMGKDLNVSGWKNWTDFYASTGTTGENYGTRLLDAWTPTNTDSTIPAIHLNNNNDEGRMSTYFIESGAYMKIRNIEVGYTMPQSFIQKLGLQRGRVALRADNVARLMKTRGDNAYTGLDPETPGNSYPLPLSFTASLNLTF